MDINKVLRMINSAGGVDAFRAAAPLPKNTQEVIDNAVVRVGRHRLVIAADLMAAVGVPLSNWLSVPSITSHKVSESGRASVSMVPKTRGERQIQQWTPYTIPIPCIWDDFSFNIREMAAAERGGQPLDTTHIEQATRNVNEFIEDGVINGYNLTDAGNSLPGLLSSTETQDFVDNEVWTHANHSAVDIETDILNMIQIMQTNRFFGPYTLYIPTTYSLRLARNWSDGVTTFPITIKQRLQQIDTGSGGVTVKVADFLPADTVILIQMTSDVIDIFIGQQPRAINWSDGPGFEEYFAVLACVVPRVKSNSDGHYGIVIGKPTN